MMTPDELWQISSLTDHELYSKMRSECNVGADLGGGCRGCAPPPHPTPSTRDDLPLFNATGFLQKIMWIRPVTSSYAIP